MLVSCVICGNEFEKRRRGPSKYCSEPCRRVFELREHHRKRAAKGLPRIGDTISCERCGNATERRGRSGPFYCPSCSKERRKETHRMWINRHPDKRYEIDRAQYLKKQANPKWRAWARIYFRLQSAKRRATPRGQIDHAMNTLVRMNMVKGTGKLLSNLVGYTPAELRRHVERQFIDGMTWNNRTKWHLDHIVPKSAFTYSSPDDPAFKACWALTNLRPLWGHENVRKSAKRTHLI